jgi:hypothetical protein
MFLKLQIGRRNNKFSQGKKIEYGEGWAVQPLRVDFKQDQTHRMRKRVGRD